MAHPSKMHRRMQRRFDRQSWKLAGRIESEETSVKPRYSCDFFAVFIRRLYACREAGELPVT